MCLLHTFVCHSRERENPLFVFFVNRPLFLGKKRIVRECEVVFDSNYNTHFC